MLVLLSCRKNQSGLHPKTKVTLPLKFFICFLKKFWPRRRHYYSGLLTFVSLYLAHAFSGLFYSVSRVDHAVQYRIGHCGFSYGITPVRYGELRRNDDWFVSVSVLNDLHQVFSRPWYGEQFLKPRIAKQWQLLCGYPAVLIHPHIAAHGIAGDIKSGTDAFYSHSRYAAKENVFNFVFLFIWIISPVGQNVIQRYIKKSPEALCVRWHFYYGQKGQSEFGTRGAWSFFWGGATIGFPISIFDN